MNGKDRRKDKEETPAWAEPFLAALRTGMGVRAAARAVGAASSTPYHLRRRDVPFRKAWDSIETVDDRHKRTAKSPGSIPQASQKCCAGRSIAMRLGQVQNEFTLNEALIRIDLLVHPAVEKERGEPPADP
jgi:hypothetical protein